MQHTKQQPAHTRDRVDTAIDLMALTLEDKTALQAAVAKAEASFDRGEFVTPDELKAHLKSVIDRHR